MTPPLHALFVAGAGTGIGKTYVTAALTRRLCAVGRPVLALKPVASGVPPVGHPDFAASDTGLLLAAQGLPITAETVEAISPWRFAAPLAPDLAAAREGLSLRLEEIVGWCRATLAIRADDAARRGSRFSSTHDAGTFGSVLIEGVGGLMSPVTDQATGLDWLKALDIPAILVSGSYLGAISHALTAAETMAAHRIPLRAIVVSESEGAPVGPDIVAAVIVRHTAVPVVVLRRGASDAEGLLGHATGQMPSLDDASA